VVCKADHPGGYEYPTDDGDCDRACLHLKKVAAPA
jgi:hypothetical protein